MLVSMNFFIKNVFIKLYENKIEKNTYDGDILRILKYQGEESHDQSHKNLIIYLTLFILDNFVMKNKEFKIVEPGSDSIKKSSSIASISTSSKPILSSKPLPAPNSSNNHQSISLSKSTTISNIVPKPRAKHPSAAKPKVDTSNDSELFLNRVITSIDANQISPSNPNCTAVISPTKRPESNSNQESTLSVQAKNYPNPSNNSSSSTKSAQITEFAAATTS